MAKGCRDVISRAVSWEFAGTVEGFCERLKWTATLTDNLSCVILQNILVDLEKKKGQIDELLVKANALQKHAKNKNNKEMLKNKGELRKPTSVIYCN